MKEANNNCAENYESSECKNHNNQKLADDLDKIDLVLFQVQNALRAARIRAQNEESEIECTFDLKHFEEMSKGLLSTARQIRETVHRQTNLRADVVCPSLWMTGS